MKKNVVLAQSGGPTSVINNSLKGAIDTFLSSDRVEKIYGSKMGILGVLREELVDISAQDRRQIELLSQTPSAGVIGSCRYKIRSDEDLERIVEVFRKHNVGYFLYCGGEDSMDTANKVSRLAREKGLEVVCVGIPKTIDNDLGGPLGPDGTFEVCDHDPGYGSVARNIAMNVLEANEENKASYTSDPVLVIGVMGRKIGFIPAAARLADPERKMPLVIILPEAFLGEDWKTNLDFITFKINERLKEARRCIVIIGEGVNVGDLGVLKDSFGHSQFSASEKSAEQVLANYLNGLDRKDSAGRAQSRLVVDGIARYEKPGTRQRREMAYVSKVDLEEAYEVGAYAARLALNGETGYMATILRVSGDKYSVEYSKIPLDVVANSARIFPKDWICTEELDVTDDFVRWALPLIGDPLPEFAKFDEILAPKLCPPYEPAGFRKKQ
ncbi:MAG TPA: diphosphate--fructose-6-phosphate 1-phosphotransferase [Kosmotoga arenicorallina]|uniref:Pyrophosphate--fructose 6-phosphate 1-phosphotransferase n=1 Tax=Kosmotoga arenicorallina TaxID=688066 RepID=A0A7C5DUU6_9BACT|nr:diphosphate--fructose-6-phosphate 1-phosphotransferase [Kosmotoga arenicorallina]